MELNKIKKEMIEWKDFFGGDIPDTEEIKNAKTKNELQQILHRHSSRLEDMLSDAQSHLANFKKKLGLNRY